MKIQEQIKRAQRMRDDIKKRATDDGYIIPKVIQHDLEMIINDIQSFPGWYRRTDWNDTNLRIARDILVLDFESNDYSRDYNVSFCPRSSEIKGLEHSIRSDERTLKDPKILPSISDEQKRLLLHQDKKYLWNVQTITSDWIIRVVDHDRRNHLNATYYPADGDTIVQAAYRLIDAIIASVQRSQRINGLTEYIYH